MFFARGLYYGHNHLYIKKDNKFTEILLNNEFIFYIKHRILYIFSFYKLLLSCFRFFSLYLQITNSKNMIGASPYDSELQSDIIRSSYITFENSLLIPLL